MLATQPPSSADAPYDAVVATPFGRVGVRTRSGVITEIVYLPPGTPERSPTTPLAARACVEIERYVSDSNYRPELPLAPAGTPFQQRVWRAISAIPPGEARTYGDLARALQSSPRAVGQACGSNPYPLVVPCHRVTSASGLGGFAHSSGGFLIAIKRWLLSHEGAPV
jgi:methylated-DNA-[protein]-cysteine S-methyltransferase